MICLDSVLANMPKTMFSKKQNTTNMKRYVSLINVPMHNIRRHVINEKLFKLVLSICRNLIDLSDDFICYEWARWIEYMIQSANISLTRQIEWQVTFCYHYTAHVLLQCHASRHQQICLCNTEDLKKMPIDELGMIQTRYNLDISYIWNILRVFTTLLHALIIKQKNRQVFKSRSSCFKKDECTIKYHTALLDTHINIMWTHIESFFPPGSEYPSMMKKQCVQMDSLLCMNTNKEQIKQLRHGKLNMVSKECHLCNASFKEPFVVQFNCCKKLICLSCMRNMQQESIYHCLECEEVCPFQRVIDLQGNILNFIYNDLATTLVKDSMNDITPLNLVFVQFVEINGKICIGIANKLNLCRKKQVHLLKNDCIVSLNKYLTQ
jgi:hypothetical protein